MDQSVLDLSTMNLDLGILLALACAFVANLGFFYKYRGANEVPKVQVLHPFRSARRLYSSKWFTLGMLTATASWGLHVGALAMAPMSVVQVVMAALNPLAAYSATGGPVQVVGSAAEVPAGFRPSAVVLAVKPQQMRGVARELLPLLKRQLVLTIAAGIRLADLSRWLVPWAREAARVGP